MYSEKKMAQISNDYVPRMRRYFAQQASARGYQVIETPLGEFIKSGGSAKCLTLRLDP